MAPSQDVAVALVQGMLSKEAGEHQARVEEVGRGKVHKEGQELQEEVGD